jgi:PD-(D/E)XK endonuclease
MMDSLRRGTISQTAVLNRLVELGLEVLLPWEPYLRYDLAYYVTEEQRYFGFFVHRECRLVRIQVKSGRLKHDGGSFVFSTQSLHYKSKTENVRRGYAESAEYFAVYLPDNSKVYMVPTNQAPKSDMELHFKSAGVNFGGRHGRISHYTYEEALSMKFTVYWAEDYEI